MGFGFHERMIAWIMECVSSTSYSICINGNLHGYFQGKRGLRQGDPLSPYLFTLVMEVLTLMFKRKVMDSDCFSFHRYCDKLELINLCFADDLFIFAYGDVQSVVVIKECLDEFKHASGLILGRLPVKYLGVPLVSSRLKARDCKELVEKVQNRVLDWKNKALSIAGRLQLIRSVISSMHVFWASVFVIPNRVLMDIEQCMRNFLWCPSSSSKGKAKVAWELVCLPKDEGGLGIRRLEHFNSALLVSHIWNLLSLKESLWVKWVHVYKLNGRNFWDVPIRGNMSWSWRKILQLRPSIREFIWRKIGNGSSTSIWFDKWCLEGPLAFRVSPRDIHRAGLTLYSQVGDVIRDGDWVWPRVLLDKYQFLNECMVPLSNNCDTLEWRLYDGTVKRFSVAQAARLLYVVIAKFIVAASAFYLARADDEENIFKIGADAIAFGGFAEHNDAPPKGEKRVKRSKESKRSKFAKGSSSKHLRKDSTTYVSKQQSQQQEWDAWEEENVIDEDEVIPEDVTPELIAESQNVDKRVPTIFDHARMEATLRDSLSNMSKNAEEYAYHLEQSTSFIENQIYGNTEEKKYILSLQKIHAEEFPELDLEEKVYKQNQKKAIQNPEDYYSNHKITKVVRIVTDQPHGLDFMEQILVMRANDKPYNFSEANFKYLNKNDIEDLYYLCRSKEIDNQKVKLMNSLITFIRKHVPYTIVDEPRMGLIYLNSKDEKRVMYLEEIVKFCDATLEKVLNEVKLRMFESKFLKKPPLLGQEEAPYWTTLGKRESYKSRSSLDGVGARTLYYARKDFLDCHLLGELEIARDAKINPFKDVLVFRRMVEFLGAIPINLKINMWESEDLIKSPINWDKPPKNGDEAWYAKIRLIDPDEEEFTKTLQSVPTSRQLSKKEDPKEIIDLDHFYDT
ncbi:putative reverse transcriptase domain, reverse transcriptase zinc-binding domain protein [Tanacetum coccineum]|uniref:Reverse transcriptase domain, reverse transcriptase zinc-binding domain protein n=1 Tax=Tanacetum coccineum TaxID=301880 RepID=A0ABQ5AI69_9ASTR